MLGENEPTFLNDFEELYPYLDYRVEDEDGKLVTKSTANSGTSLTDKTLSSYALGIVITYDKNGTIDAKIAKGEYKEDQSIEMRKVIGNMDAVSYTHLDVYKRQVSTCPLTSGRYMSRKNDTIVRKSRWKTFA